MKNFGATFRYLREARGISLSSLADDVVSKGMISKFENGTSDLSTTRFFHLLDAIYVTPYEFMIVMNHFKPLHTNRFLKKVTACALAQNVPGLKRLANEQYERWQQSQSLFDQLNWIMPHASSPKPQNNLYPLKSTYTSSLIIYSSVKTGVTLS